MNAKYVAFYINILTNEWNLAVRDGNVCMWNNGCFMDVYKQYEWVKQYILGRI